MNRDITKRLVYIDYLKSIGILFIILGHLPITNDILHKWIFSFHVPLFFFISGLLYKRKDNYKSYFIKNFKQLILIIIPYFIINKSFTYIQDIIFYPNEVSFNNNVLQPSINTLLGKSEMGPMWFLISLFWIRIIYNYLYIAIQSRYNIIYIFFVSIIISYIVYINNFRFNYYQIASTFIALPYYCMGVITQKYKVIHLLLSPRICWIYSLLYLITIYYFLQHTSMINLNELNIGNNFFLYYFIALFSIFFIINIATYLKSPKHYIEVISQGTIFILGTHMIFIQLFKYTYKSIFNINHTPPYMDTFSAIFISIIIITISYYFIVSLINSKYKFLRFLIGKS